MANEAIFFDRDGVITEPISGEAAQSPNQLQIKPEITRVLWASRNLGYLNFVISNQPDIALGKIDEERRQALMSKFQTLIEENHLPIDGIYYCFHHPQGKKPEYSIDCECRKPKPGMILEAASNHNIDLSRSFTIGDRASDIKAGALAGTRTILFDEARSQNPYLRIHNTSPDYTVTSLDEITSILIRENQPQIKAMVLAAGKGDRMMPLTANLPKPLLEVANKPMIEYVISLLVAHGVGNIGINIHHFGDKLIDYLGDGRQFGTSLTYMRESELTGTAGGVRNIATALKPEKPFFVISSDMMVNFDLSSVYKFHLEHDAVATLCCYWRSLDQLVADKSGIVAFDPQRNQIERFVERPQKPEDIISQWVNSSVYVFSPRLLDYIQISSQNPGVLDLPKDIFPQLLASGEKLYAYPIDHQKYYQLGIDTPDRLQRVAEDIRSGKFIPTL